MQLKKCQVLNLQGCEVIGFERCKQKVIEVVSEIGVDGIEIV